MDPSPTTPIQKNVVLVGAGNAHLQFVKMLGMRPMPGVAVTLVNEAPVVPYSAMVPGHIAREYRWDEITIDLVRLCRAMNVRFVAARAVGVNTILRKVTFASRPELSYDVVSLGLGSSIRSPHELPASDWSWPMRPLGRLLDRLCAIEDRLRDAGEPFHLAIVGGGASGCELTVAIQKRFAGIAPLHLTLLHGGDRLLPQFPRKAGATFAALMRERAVSVRCNARVTGADHGRLTINGSESLACDAVLWATNAAPPDLLRSSGLQLNANGFLLVRDTLQSLSDPTVFGTGDCISLQSHPELLKNGVYAVREGGVLFDNVCRALHEQPLTPFQPQRICLTLLNTADGSATLTYGPIAWRGRWVRRWKERIDRAWIDKFRRFKPMPASDSSDENVQMRCGGCGNKISSDVLSAVLKRIDPGTDPRILLGARAGEDASVHRVRPELFGSDPARLVEVQTVDYFKTFVDDPYLFGRIAAISAVSDLHAMNARPFSALAIATLPYARGPVQEAMLFELLSGAVESLRQLGVVLTGGHTTEGAELALGFAVTGYAEEDRLFQKSKLRPGDALILTKPLGSGALLAAWMRGECGAGWFDRLVQSMLDANDRAAKIFADAGVDACTDVTGFGLAGHLVEMIDASQVTARLDVGRIRVFDGFAEVVRRGIVSTLHSDNAKTSCRVEGDAPAWLFDPQTSGGLLAGVKRAAAENVMRALHEAGYHDAAIIGEVTAGPPRIQV